MDNSQDAERESELLRQAERQEQLLRERNARNFHLQKKQVKQQHQFKQHPMEEAHKTAALQAQQKSKLAKALKAGNIVL